MTVTSVAQRSLLWLCVILLWTSCYPPSESESDEEKDPHFLTGRTRVTQMDYKGAVEAFEQALESNPRSAAAHFELGLLYEQRLNDYGAAIYHFEKHLKLRPNSRYAQPVRDHIVSCKVELAKTVPFALVSQQVQAGLDKLTTENASLRQQVEELKTRLARQMPTLNSAPGASNSASAPNPGATEAAERPSIRPERTPSQPTVSVPARAATGARTHAIRPNETLMAVSRMYGISLAALQAANPGIEPRRLRVGQIINVPASKGP